MPTPSRVLLGLLFLLAGALTEAADRPNVLFIAVDDMNDWIGCLDSPTAALTPNIDKLAARGVNFSNAHTAGVYCAPSRAAIFSGQFASTTGCYQSSTYFVEHPSNRIAANQLYQGRLCHFRRRQTFSSFGRQYRYP